MKCVHYNNDIINLFLSYRWAKTVIEKLTKKLLTIFFSCSENSANILYAPRLQDVRYALQ